MLCLGICPLAERWRQKAKDEEQEKREQLEKKDAKDEARCSSITHGMDLCRFYYCAAFL